MEAPQPVFNLIHILITLAKDKFGGFFDQTNPCRGRYRGWSQSINCGRGDSENV